MVCAIEYTLQLNWASEASPPCRLNGSRCHDNWRAGASQPSRIYDWHDFYMFAAGVTFS